MKKVLSVLLAVLLVAAVLPMSAAAADSDFTLDSTNKLTAYNGPGGDVVIPHTIKIDGRTHIVSSIAQDIFAGRSDITSITFPETMYSFFFSSTYLNLSGCTSLENFYVAEGNTNYQAVDGLLCKGSELVLCPPARTEVTIPASVTSIGTYAFDSCQALQSIHVAPGHPALTEVNGCLCEVPTGDEKPKFLRCPPAVQGEFSFPDLSMSVEPSAFRGCSAITSIYFPANVDLGDEYYNYFTDCASLTSFNVASHNPELFSRNGLLFGRQDSGPDGLVACPAGYQGSLAVPDDVDFDYAYCPSSFSPDSIGKGPFTNCSGLTELTLNKISNFFEYDEFFTGCDSLVNLHYNPNGAGADPADEATEVDGILYIGEKGNYYTLVSYPPARTGDFTVPSTVRYIGRNAFRGRAISSITIPATVEYIWQDTFRNCPNLTRVEIAPMAEKDSSFHLSAAGVCNCGLRNISQGAFYDCPQLTYIYIPETTQRIGIDGSNVFYNSPNVTIYGAAGSYAQEVANKHSIPFNAVSLPSQPSDLPSASPSPTPTNKPTPTPKPTPKPDNRPTVGGFTDVHQGDYYANAVAWAMEKGVTSGAAKDKFGVGSPCKREQIATFLWRANGSPEASKTADFADMTNNQVFNKAISWAVEQGITSGVGNNKFGVGQTCTRVQAVTFLWIAAGKPTPEKQAAFSDMTGNPVFNNAISWAVEQGITSGTGNNKFSPNKPCTREQIVTFLYNAYK